MKSLRTRLLSGAVLFFANITLINAEAGGPGGGAAVGGGGRGGLSGVAVSSGGRSSDASAAPAARSGVSISNNAGRSSDRLAAPYRNTYNPATALAGRATSSNGAAESSRYAGRATYRSDAATTNRFAGTYLNPGAPGANIPATASNGWTDRRSSNGNWRGGHGYVRVPGRYRYNPYVYGPYYAPFISDYTVGDGYYGAYPYHNELPDSDGNLDAPTPDAMISAPQAQTDANRGTVPDNGPDSLVEAVQQELINRGYFGGKADAMFNPATKDALKKFQSDHHLAETGLINEATLHALQLD